MMIAALGMAVFLGLVPTKDITLKRIFSVLILLVIWVIIGFNTSTPDYEAYEYMYEHCFDVAYRLHEPGYIALCKVLLTCGLSYQQFRIVLATIVVIFSWLTIKKIGNMSSHTVLMLFLLFPIFQYVSGLRTALAGSIACFAVACLLDNKGQHLLRYVVWLLIACCFHYECVFYFVFVFAYKRNVNIYVLSIILLLEIIVFVALLRTNILYGVLSKFISSEKVLTWFDYGSINHPSVITIIGLLMINVFQIFILYECKRYITKYCLLDSQELSGAYNTISQLRVTKNCFCLLTLMLFGYMININFFRLTFMVLIVFYATIEKTLDTKALIPSKNASSDKFLIRIAVLALIVVMSAVIDPQVAQMAIENNLLF